MSEVFEINATITMVYPLEYEGPRVTQKLILDNVSATGTVISPESRIVLVVKYASVADAIEFKRGTPITARGIYVGPTTDFLAQMHSVHAPLGYIRYDGKVYR